MYVENIFHTEYDYKIIYAVKSLLCYKNNWMSRKKENKNKQNKQTKKTSQNIQQPFI